MYNGLSLLKIKTKSAHKGKEKVIEFTKIQSSTELMFDGPKPCTVSGGAVSLWFCWELIASELYVTPTMMIIRLPSTIQEGIQGKAIRCSNFLLERGIRQGIGFQAGKFGKPAWEE